MRKTILMLGFLCFCVLSTYSQFFLFSASEKSPEKPNHGLKATTIIQAKISTPENVKMKELIKVFKDYYVETNFYSKKNFRFVGSTDNFNVDELSDDMAEMKLVFGFRQNMTTIKYMGATAMQPPVMLGFDAVFTFDEQHNLCISFTNFQEAAFFFTEGNKFPSDPNFYSKPELNAYLQIQTTLMMTETTIGKLLMVANSGTSNYKNNLASLNSLLDEQYVIWNDYVNKGWGKWLDSKGIVDAFPANTPTNPYSSMYQQAADKKVKDGYLLIVTNNRFDKYFKEILINSFKENANLAKGKLISISRDDKMIYERVGESVLPTDSKERAKWEKAGKSL